MYAGIDTHKDTLAVAVIDHHGRPLAIEEVANTERGFTELTQLLETHHVLRVGIEGSGAFGRAVAVHLALTWDPEDCNDSPARPDDHLELGAPGVVEVPTLMTARERRAQTGKGKTDPVDALAIARDHRPRVFAPTGTPDHRHGRGPARAPGLPRRPHR